MRYFFTLVFAILIGNLLAQPANDDCSGLIDLGAVPACNTDVIYTNVDATASDIGFGNSPSCFNGGTAQNDVWFAFTTTADITDITITIIGSLDGPNGEPISNPQIALYRGDCSFDGLAELACNSSAPGSAQVQLDLLGLTPDITYFIRVNDYSATASPNWGDFTLCVDEYVPAINIGTIPTTTACFGTLYDSGGPDEDYSSNENNTFTICPTDAHSCIELNLLNFDNEDGFDFLNIYQGNGTDGPLIATANGVDNGNDFIIQAPNGCVTVEFTSDGSVESAGFELTWQCSPLACDGIGIDNPTQIGNIPFVGNFSTCGAAATFAESPCSEGEEFLGGPEYVFAYDSPGGICASITVTNGGILVLNGPPDDPNTLCVAQSEGGGIASANFEDEGTYYIIVANASGCVDFTINIQEAECVLSPALVDALCNPLNGCIDPSGLPSIFTFEDGFQDVPMVMGTNSGCWFGVGAEPDFLWFTIEAQADGPFGFILQSADNPSDIDFNVYGPFTPEAVCETPGMIVNFVTNNEPIRSSYAGGTEPTGLADIHPQLNYAIEDVYDCDGINDDIVQTIPAQAGEVYVVLVNDWGNNIGDAGISVDWSPSFAPVLGAIPVAVTGTDTVICTGQGIQIEIDASIGDIYWIDNTEGLSCVECPNPIATPMETTTYRAVVDAICYNDTIDVEVSVFDISAGEDLIVCRNEEIQINAGSNYPNAEYEWTAPAGVQLSCTDCPDPMVTALAQGTYEVAVALVTNLCVLEDTMVLTVLPGTAPEYNISDDVDICAGETAEIGGALVGTNFYSWTSQPVGFVSTNPNPPVMPTETTTYYLSVIGNDPLNCPLPALDSITVNVAQLPTIDTPDDMSVCQGDSIQLSPTVAEMDVTYQWTGPDDIVDATDPNSMAFPLSDGTYILTASRGACLNVDSFTVDITPIFIELNEQDTLTVCRGTEVPISAFVVPAGEIATWTPGDGSLDNTMANQVVATPQTITTYIATVEVPGCFRTDSITIVVDSLPTLMDVAPMDTTICEGSPVILETPPGADGAPYDPALFPNIQFKWYPLNDESFQSPDTLVQMVISGVDTTTYQRVAINGVCRDTFTVDVNVNPIPEVMIDPGDTGICEGESIDLVATSDIEPDSIMWSPNDGSLSCSDCLTPTASPTDSTIYTLQVIANMCPNTASIIIDVNAQPITEANTDQQICAGESVQLGFADDGISTYEWTSSTEPDSLWTDPFQQVTPLETTTFYLLATNDCGAVEDTVLVEVIPFAELAVTDDQIICSGDAVTLDVSSNAPDFANETTTWTWNGNSEDAMSIMDSPSDTTTYYLSYSNGCETLTDSVIVSVNVNPEVLFPDDPTICFSGSVFLNEAPDDRIDYEWSSPDDPDFMSILGNPEVSPDVTTVYEVVATVEGCPDFTGSITVPVIEQAVLTVTPLEMLICEGESATFTASSTTPAEVPQEFIWMIDGVVVGTDATLVLDEVLNTTDVELTYSYGPACETLIEVVTVTVEPNIVITDLAVDPGVDIKQGQSVTITANTNAPNVDNLNFNWMSTDDGIDNEAGNTITDIPRIIPVTVYTVTVSSTETSCSAIDSIAINIEAIEPAIPNVFTPNNDGKNDFFILVTPTDSEEVEITDFKIYNRWGQIVYDNDNNTQGWDGTHNGDPAPSDVYVYSITWRYRTDGRVENGQGDVTLVR